MAETFTEIHKGHYFATSIAEFRTGTDLDKLVRIMKNGGFNFRIFVVPLLANEEYPIKDYAPDVPGCVLLTEYIVKK